MVSGKSVVLTLGFVVLLGVGLALSIWKSRTEAGNRRAAEEMTAHWEARYDSLTTIIDSLKSENQRLRSISDSLSTH